MSENRLSRSLVDLFAQLDSLDLADALSFLTDQQLATAETAAELVLTALEQAESASRVAQQRLSVAAALNEQLGVDPALEAQIHYAQARVHLHLGELKEAERALYSAQSHWQALHDQAAMARSYLGLTQILALQGRFDAAEETILHAIDLLPADSLQRAWAFSNLANLLDRRGEYEKSLANYDEAQTLLLSLRRQATDQEQPQLDSELADLDVNRANVLVALDRPEQAEQAYIRALTHATQSANVLLQGRLACNLGNLYLRTGRYADALHYLDRAEAILLGDFLPLEPIDHALLRQADMLLLDQAQAYLALNLRNEAITSLERCQVLFRTANQPYELAQSLYLLGLLLLRHSDIESGNHHLTEAYKIFDKLNNLPWRNRAELALAEVDEQRGSSVAAAARLDRLLASMPVRSEQGSLAWTRDLSTTIEASLLRLQLHLNEDNHEAAEQLAEQIDVLLNEAIPLPHLRQRLLYARGRIDLQRGHYSEAQRHFYTALRILEEQRTSLPLEEFRTAYLADKYHIHTSLVLSLLHEDIPSQEAIHEAFSVIERARARSLHERLEATWSHAGDTEESGVETEDSLPASDPLYSKLHWFYNQIFADSDDAPDVHQELRHYEAMLERMAWKSASTAPVDGARHLPSQEPVSLSAFQQSLGADQQAILYYIVPPDRRYWGAARQEGEVLAFVVERERVHLHRRLCTAHRLAQAQSELRFQLGRAELGPAYLARHQDRLTQSLQEALHQLYTLLISPLTAHLHAARLLIVPYGSLHLMPFHALWDGERHLIECFTCSYAPSASVTVQYIQDNRYAIPYRSFAGLALTDPAIPQAKKEVELAAQTFTERHLFLDEAASRAGLVQAAARAEVLHIATHGLFRPDNPFFSSLRLADGWVDVRTLYRLRLAARLVVLSACDSGSGDIRGGDEVIGLARGFLGAGAQDLVVSLWNVHDAQAIELMAVFYEHLAGGATPAASLQAAQRHFIAQGKHAYYWASFLTIGA